jgi:XTP/dITP diphosphohydrolase
VTIRSGDRLLVATTNAGKLREIRELLHDVPLDVIALAPEFEALPAPDETGRTFAENARLKARYYAAETGLLTVAEDSGLEIDALDGAPGVFSARYPGATYPERFRNLYAEMAARGAAGSTARFVCALALARPQASTSASAAAASAEPAIVFEARGVVEGEIANPPRGEGGFGYDPIFYYPAYGQTLAEVSSADKLLVSHRGAAFRQLKVFLNEHLSPRATPS